MRLFAQLTFAAFLSLCAGCSTIGMHLFPASRNPVYSGTRNDCHGIVHPDGSAMVPVASCVDLPFSFVADTLFLPSDLVDWSEMSRPDPLKDWTFKPFPVGRSGNLTTNTLDPAIVADYQGYIKKKGLSAGGVTGYFEDGKGHVGIEFEAYSGNESWVYALIYDHRNKRIKTVRFNHQRYMC
jgi:uncharacterized protein YceK